MLLTPVVRFKASISANSLFFSCVSSWTLDGDNSLARRSSIVTFRKRFSRSKTTSPIFCSLLLQLFSPKQPTEKGANGCQNGYYNFFSGLFSCNEWTHDRLSPSLMVAKTCRSFINNSNCISHCHWSSLIFIIYTYCAIKILFIYKDKVT